MPAVVDEDSKNNKQKVYNVTADAAMASLWHIMPLLIDDTSHTYASLSIIYGVGVCYGSVVAFYSLQSHDLCVADLMRDLTETL